MSPRRTDVDNIEDIFVKEDLSKPENRVNLALFSLMQQDWFRKWILERLCLPPDAVVYPPTNVRSLRPDLKVVADSCEAVIEVELGTNPGQAEVYREHFNSVRTIWGKRESGCDLSFEEIAEFLMESRRLSPQTRINVQHLSKLIDEGLREHSSSRERREVSEGMWAHTLVVALRERLGDSLVNTTKRVGIGRLKADTVGNERLFAEGQQAGYKRGGRPTLHHRRRTPNFPQPAEAHPLSAESSSRSRCLYVLGRRDEL